MYLMIGMQDHRKQAEMDVTNAPLTFKLNIGGRKQLEISKNELIKHQGSLFYYLIACGKWKADDQGKSLVHNHQLVEYLSSSYFSHINDRVSLRRSQ